VKHTNWFRHFLIGAAQLIGPSPVRSDVIPDVDPATDAYWIQRDWEAVGNHLWRAVKEVDDTLLPHQKALIRSRFDVDRIFEERNLR
jgi:hypothetical protein